MLEEAGNSEYQRPDQHKRLKKDLREASASLMGVSEIRYLVDIYYQKQEARKAEGQQYEALEKSGEPNEFLKWVFKGSKLAEDEIKKQLNYYTLNEPTGMGRWCQDIFGVGAVITAGLLAHVRIENLKGASSLWRYAGIDPTVKWYSKKDAEAIVKQVMKDLDVKDVNDDVVAKACELAGKDSAKVYKWACEYSKRKDKKPTATSLASSISRRPWNASMKVLAFKIGDSFKFNCNNPKCFYGHLYKTKRTYYENKSLAGDYRERAAEILRTKNIGKEKVAYQYYTKGELPPSHIVAMAKRWTAKLFLAHFFEEWYRKHNNEEPPKPYPIAFLGHAHVISPPPPDYYAPQVQDGRDTENPDDWADLEIE
jgi:hypothetical protein